MELQIARAADLLWMAPAPAHTSEWHSHLLVSLIMRISDDPIWSCPTVPRVSQLKLHSLVVLFFTIF